jgi:hypothetical protein
MLRCIESHEPSTQCTLKHDPRLLTAGGHARVIGDESHAFASQKVKISRSQEVFTEHKTTAVARLREALRLR